MIPSEVIAALAASGIEAEPAESRAVGGGSISRTFRIATRHGPFFLKLEPLARADLLDAEADALCVLRQADAVTVPGVVAAGRSRDDAWLALEWIEFGPKTPAAERLLGEGLARLHGAVARDFGWHRDNYIGSTPQRNARSGTWARFFRERRLVPQLELARRRGLQGEAVELCEQLVERLDSLLDAHAPAPSLLHGDLWGGNWAVSTSGLPCVYDPAAYYGDREADLAMTRLFGGFGADFYRAYESVSPLPDGAELRADVYNLYHVLNHFNLFGSGYAGEALRLLRRVANATR